MLNLLWRKTLVAPARRNQEHFEKNNETQLIRLSQQGKARNVNLHLFKKAKLICFWKVPFYWHLNKALNYMNNINSLSVLINLERRIQSAMINSLLIYVSIKLIVFENKASICRRVLRENAKSFLQVFWICCFNSRSKWKRSHAVNSMSNETKNFRSNIPQPHVCVCSSSAWIVILLSLNYCYKEKFLF